MTGEATRLAAVDGAREGDRDRGRAAADSPPTRSTSSTARWCARAPPAGPSITLGEIAKALAPASKLRGGRAPGLAAEGWFHTDHMTYPYGVHIAVVRVDRETGAVASSAILIAYDVGRAVNPMLVEGQLVGGFAQGLGGALLEEFVYDERGEPLSVNFADYLMPTAREMPALDVLITEDAPSPLNPLGLKGRGRGRHQRGRRRHRVGDRRCHRHAGRGHAAAGDAAAAARYPQARRPLIRTSMTNTLRAKV